MGGDLETKAIRAAGARGGAVNNTEIPAEAEGTEDAAISHLHAPAGGHFSSGPAPSLSESRQIGHENKHGDDWRSAAVQSTHGDVIRTKEAAV